MNCAECGNEFKAVVRHPNQEYCQDTCRAKAQRKRERDAKRAKRLELEAARSPARPTKAQLPQSGMPVIRRIKSIRIPAQKDSFCWLYGT